MREHSAPLIDPTALAERVAAAEPWALDLPPGPEFRYVRQLLGLTTERVAPVGDVSVRSVSRYEREEVVRSTALEAPRFRRLVTVLYEMAAEQNARAAKQAELRAALAGAHEAGQ